MPTWMVEFPAIYMVAIAIVAGDGLGNFHFFIPLWIAVALTCIAAILFVASQKLLGIVAALIAIASAATVPVHALLNPANGPASLRRFSDDSTVTIEGRLLSPPEHMSGDRTYLFVTVVRAGKPGSKLAPASGLVRVSIRGHEGFRVGDEVTATARIRFPRNDGNPGEFDYKAWLMRQDIAATMYAGRFANGTIAISVIGHRNIFPASEIEAVRDRIGHFIDANLDYPESAVMKALVIGDRGGISPWLRNRFALTGMAHLLVISGLHLGFVAAAAFFFVRLLMGFFPSLMARGYANKVAAATAAVVVVAYASIAGHQVSTERALIMVLAYTVAILLDRSREVLASLALAALVICFGIPGSTANISFQLSFASVLVILLGMRRFTAWWRWRFANPLVPGASSRSRLNLIAEVIAGYFAVSFWALLGTAPLTAYHFNQFAMVGLVANAVVVPIMGFGATVCGLIAAALSFICMPVARVVLWTAGYLASAGIALAGWFERWPMAWTHVFTPTLIELVIAYGLVALWLTMPLAHERFESGEESARAENAVDPNRGDSSGDVPPIWLREWRRAAVAILLVALTVDGGWWTYQRYFNPDLRVTFLSVGEGDAAVVRFPGSRVMLIDAGGGYPGGFDPGEEIVAPYLWEHKIMHVDYMALSHPDRDHFGGFIFIAQNFSPSQFWTGGATSTDVTYQELLQAVARAHTFTRECDAESPPMTIGGVSVRCIAPLASELGEKDNNRSMVMRLSYDGTSLLFTGDIEAPAEHALIDSGAKLHATILKVPHHGSHTSSTIPFVEAVDPKIAVISLGYHNRFHFPSSAVVKRYQKIGAPVLRTDQVGAVSVDIGRNGPQVWSYRGGLVNISRKRIKHYPR